MLSIAIILFIIAGILGSMLLIAILNNQPTPKNIKYWHGPVALLGLILVIFAIYYGRHNPMIIVTATLFIFAATGGLSLFIMGLLNKPRPKWLLIGHPILALIAIILLVIYVFHWKKDVVSIYAVNQELNLKL